MPEVETGYQKTVSKPGWNDEMLSLIELDSLGSIQDIDTPVGELEMIISVDYAPIQIDWDGSFFSNPIINPMEENFKESLEKTEISESDSKNDIS